MTNWRWLVLPSILAITVACSTTDKEQSGTDNDDGTDTRLTPPTLSLSAAPQAVVPGGETQISWNSTDAEDCVAMGAWSGSKGASGQQNQTINSESHFTLQCSGPGGSTTKTVTVSLITGSDAIVQGMVDSSYVARFDENAVYVFSGNVTPKDLGSNNDPVAVLKVNQQHGACTWHYNSGALAPGQYTLAFTKQAALDSPSTIDNLVFAHTQVVELSAGTNLVDFRPANIIQVGPTRTYKTPGEAAAIATSGDVIEIDAAEYLDDIVVWRDSNLTIRGIGGRPHLRATKPIPYTAGNDQENGMGIWVTKASGISIENIEFSGSKILTNDGSKGNGSGIRVQSNNISICNCNFHDNENGILGGGGTLLVEFSEFNHNGLGEVGKTHNIYVDGSERLIFRHNYSHHAYIGHNLKTRAKENHILYNRLMDEADGRSSYAIDVSNGGLTYVIGNLIQQGTGTDNATLVTYGPEGLLSGRTHNLYVVNNTFVNDNGSGLFVRVATGTTSARIINNIFTGGGQTANGPHENINNLASATPGLVDRSNYNYQLLSNSEAIDAGVDPGLVNGYSLIPVYQYLHTASRQVRPMDTRLDIGAMEYQP